MNYPRLSAFLLALIMGGTPAISAELLLTKEDCWAELNKVHMLIARSGYASEDQDRFLEDEVDARGLCSSGDYEGALALINGLREEFAPNQG